MYHHILRKKKNKPECAGYINQIDTYTYHKSTYSDLEN